MTVLKTLILSLFAFISMAFSADSPLTFEGKDGPGEGYHIVLIAGDEEYRSEEAMPQLAKILATHHGFKCSVLFSVNDKGEIDPANTKSLTFPETIDDADLIILGLRFRQWPDESMTFFKEAIDRGTPIIGTRTTTHAFKYPKDSKSLFSSYSFNSKDWEGGFGRQIMGETWVNHHGKHNQQGTRSVIEASQKAHPILQGVGEIFGKTDVYGANPPAECTILVRGAVTESLEPDSKNVEGEKNSPMMPIVWTREVLVPAGISQRILTTTMGSSQDFLDEDLRRLIVNGVYWCLEMEEKMPKVATVNLVGDYKPTHFGFNTFTKGVKPETLK